MAKRNYGIPYSLNDSSYLDLPITIKSESGLSMKPITLKSLLIIVFGFSVGIVAIAKTSIARGTLFEKILFLALWGTMCYLVLTTTKTKEYGYHRLANLVRYLQPMSRRINTRRSAPAVQFATVAGIRSMDPDTGIISYTDGSFGMVFDVIGNASYLLFESHKTDILDRVDNHYRKMHPGVTYHFVTVKQPQEVDEQVENLNLREDALTTNDPDLVAMLETERGVLRRYVGSQCKSLHQYMVMQAGTLEDLHLGYEVFRSEVENSVLMFKRVVQLGVPEAQRFFAGVYSGSKGVV